MPHSDVVCAAERAKESTLSVEMVEQRQRSSSSGSTIFDFEYELESTRGRKRILSTGEKARFGSLTSLTSHLNWLLTPPPPHTHTHHGAPLLQ